MVFPSPTGININMMPFLMGNMDTIPKEYHQYKELILSCCADSLLPGTTCFLTIQENYVESGETHRRCGIHTDAHRNAFLNPSVLSRFSDGGYSIPKFYNCGGSTVYNWGGFVGCQGIFLCSNSPNSCAAWDVGVDDDSIGDLGDCEELRDELGAATSLLANTMYWMTDRTPHESLRLPVGAHRQFFRVVSSNVDLWYEANSTPNPLHEPPSYVLVVTENKFDRFAQLVSPEILDSNATSFLWRGAVR